ncbi:MAG: hypothetical protein ACI970_001759 [Myxococcota bacterium]|jgi:hypothetical protein
MGEVPRGKGGQLMASSKITISNSAAAKARVDAAVHALDDDLATLTDRVPGIGQIAKGGAAGGTGLTLLGIGLKVAQKKMSERSRDTALTREATIQAKAIAAAMAAHAEVQRAAAAVAAPAAAPVRTQLKATPALADAVTNVAADGLASIVASDDGRDLPWGIIALLVALIAAVVAVVTRSDDDDLWNTTEG